MLTSASNQSRCTPVQRATVVLAQQRDCSGTFERIWNHILRLDICSCGQRMPSWSLELVPRALRGRTVAAAPDQETARRHELSRYRYRAGSGWGPPSTKQGASRSPNRRTREGRQAETPTITASCLWSSSWKQGSARSKQRLTLSCWG